MLISKIMVGLLRSNSLSSKVKNVLFEGESHKLYSFRLISLNKDLFCTGNYVPQHGEECTGPSRVSSQVPDD